jgi:hypothetical protein
LCQYGVESRDNWHAQLAQQSENVTTSFTPEDSVFVLQTEQIDGIYIQEISGAAVRRDFTLGDLKANSLGIGVSPAYVVHGNDETVNAIDLCLQRVG